MQGKKPSKGWGGARPGAGRKPKPKPAETPPPQVETRDPLEFLLDVMQGKVAATTVQVRAAVAASQYLHAKKGEGGKKEESAGKAKAAGSGKFGQAAPPRLAAANGRKVE